jgi:stearoyl-CoA desaturase (delta-9 desaturase)
VSILETPPSLANVRPSITPSTPAEPGIPVPVSVRVGTAIAVIVPSLVALAAMWLAWGGWFGYRELALLLTFYVLTGMGITIGYHRLFTHRSFEAKPVVFWTFGILGSMAGQGPAIWWCSTHRKHHKHSDHEHDPHSPNAHREHGIGGWIRSFTHSHLGWLITRPEDSDPTRYVPDLLADRRMVFLSQTFVVWVLLGFALPALIGGLVSGSWWGAFLGFLWGGLLRMCLVHHITWSVNSICHLWGKQPYRSGDDSRNNPFVGILAFGEGWHNNHHAFPTSARHGLGRWQFDSSWLVIRGLEKCGLVTRVRVPSEARLREKAVAA